MSKYKKLISNTAILGIGTFSSKVLVYLLMRFYTEYLTTEQFSSADLVTQSGYFLMPLACCGIVDSIFRFTLDRSSKEDLKRVFSTGFNILMLSSIAFLVLSPMLLLANDYFGGYAWLIPVYVITANVHAAVSQYIRAKGETALFALQGLINTALVIGLNILFLAVFNMGVVGYVSSIIVANVTVALFLIISRKLWREYDIKILDRPLAKELLKYSLPIIPSSIFWWITIVSDRFMIIGMLTPVLGDAGAKSLNGLYSAAQKIPTIVTLLTTIFIEAWHFSAVTETEGKDEEKRSFFTEVFASFSGLLFLVCGGIILFSELLTRLMVSDNFFESWKYIPVLVIATTFSGLCTFVASVYVVEKKSMQSLLTSMAGAVVNIALNIILIPTIGAMGAAIATLLSHVSVLVIRLVNARSYVSFNVDYINLTLNVILVSLAAFFMTFGLPYRYAATFIACVALFVLNGKPIFTAIGMILRKFTKRKM